MSNHEVGPYTQFAGVERLPEGNCHFAGEHTSVDFQGYLNGAVETGERAANEILADLKMKYQETLTFESDKPIEPELLIGLAEHLQQEGIKVYFLDVDLDAIERCQKLIAEKGPSYVLSIERFQEAVLPRTESKDRRDLLVRILSSQLQSLSPSRDLVIVDPYFFPTNLRDRADYLSIFREVFSPVIPNIAHVRFITKPEYDEGMYKSIEQELVALNPQIKVSHRTTNDFHDRFWIVDETKGLFIGTSLNGIGRKYALTDYIKDEDTAAITEELRRLNLL